MKFLSDNQEIAMSICMVISGLLSMFGSTTIVYRVLRKDGNTKPFDRLMLGLSVFDVIASFSFVLTPFVLPKETSVRVWAFGNKVSCSVLGWLSQLSVGAAWYSCLLSFFFLATLRLRITNSDFEVRFEPYMHGLTVFYFLFSATFGVVFDIYGENDLQLGCWVKEVPKGCDEDGGCLTITTSFFMGGLPLFFTLFALPINYILTFSHVRKVLKFVARHNPVQAAHIRRLAEQGTLYVLAYFTSYGPQLVIRMLATFLDYGREDEPAIYWLLVLNSICYPLQGFLNMFVYSRPNFLRLRAAGMPFWDAVRAACFEADISKYLDRRNNLLQIRSSVHYDSSEEMDKYHSRVESKPAAVTHLLSQEFKAALGKTRMPDMVQFLPSDDDENIENSEYETKMVDSSYKTEVVDSSEEARG
eukprot:CAMPEP_0113632232 /NCGR_PEP_ID=MMETSP0017_2-20120614/16750_1 /TAXON_ID=2856 /ORGANISM="Cylindrotheca closterium" /LENGTH=415 /DNA_ID=CAMNT_0000542773 /DNA_START=105 /DNA_END=1352 /DNA_ORIENTATION=+ /assembly_acc=CAM_ASM_000147